MKKTLPPILLLLMLFSLLSHSDGQVSFSSFEGAKLHPVTSDRPAPDFFEGALLGNGAMGVVVTTRPDAVVLYFGHNNVWDIRVSENNREKIGTFKDVYNRVNTIPDTLSLLTQDPWYDEYSRMTAENYSKPYPRPFPCGSVLLGFDRRNAEMIGHRLDISNGLCEVLLMTKEKKKLSLQIFTDMASDNLWFRLVDNQGNICENIFDRIRVIPDPSTPAEFPKAKTEEDLGNGIISFRQILPYLEPDKYDASRGHPKDKAFRLIASVNSTLEKRSRINWDGNVQEMAILEAGIKKNSGFYGCISLQEGLNSMVDKDLPQIDTPKSEEYQATFQKSELAWQDYWSKSVLSSR
jgi:hypothetical protein